MTLGVAVGVTVTVGVGLDVGDTVGVGVGEGPLYSSALEETVRPFSPPAASTIPLGSKVAVCRARALLRLPVIVHVPLAASYSSPLTELRLLLSNPPAASVVSLGNKVAVCPERPMLRLPVAVHVPLAGSYNSALTEGLPPLSRWPSKSRWLGRIVPRLQKHLDRCQLPLRPAPSRSVARSLCADFVRC